MTRRSVFAALAAAVAALAAFRPLRALHRRPPDRGGCYRGYLRWDRVTAKGLVSRPDHSTLEPLPVDLVEEELIMLRFKPWKYGTPPPADLAR